MLIDLEKYKRRGDAAFRWAAALALAGIAVLAQAAWAQDAAPAASQSDPVLDALLVIVKKFGGAVAAGQAFAAVVLAVVGLVLLLRVFGKRLHDAIPDDSLWDKPLWFLFDTKPGGMVLNALTSFGLSMTAIASAGTTITPAIAGLTALGSGGVVGFATALYGWGKDLYEWWKQRKPDPAPAIEAGKAAAKDPGPTLNG